MKAKDKDKGLEQAVPEEPAAEDTTVETEAADSEKSEQELLAEKYDDLNDRYMRLMAEYDNYRKRTQKERDDIYPSATANAVAKFLPVLDNLERAEGYEPGSEEFAKGFSMICQNFREIMTGLKVEEIGVVGEPFDPAFHNAVMHIEDESLGENVVSQVLQKGYKIGDKVVRYAMVQTAN